MSRTTSRPPRRGLDDSTLPQSRVDLRGRVLAVNRAMEELLGETEADLVGQDALALYVPEDRPGLEQGLAELASGATPFVQREQTLRLRGRDMRVVMTVTLTTGEDGAPCLAGTVQDVTALHAAREAVQEQADRFAALLMSMPVAVFTFDAHGVCTSSRGAALRRLGFADDQLVGDDLVGRYADVPEAQRSLRRCLAGEDVFLESEVGDRAWETHYRPTRAPDGTVTGGMGVSIDVTDRVAAEREVRAHDARVRALLRHAHDVVAVLDRTGRLLYVSPAVTAHFGYDDTSLFWRSGPDFDHPDDAPAVAAAFRRVLREPGAVERVESRVRHADGGWRWTDHVLTNLLDDPDVRGVVLNLRDLSERRSAERALEHRGLHDGLTGLANRALLLDRAVQALRRRGGATGLVLLDVVGTAAVNSTHGLSGGDAVLQAVADRLRESVRDSDSVARVGADEFAVLALDVASVEDLRTRAASLAEAASGPVPVGEGLVDVTVRTGTALTPAADAGALLAAAERSLHAGTAAADDVEDCPGSGDEVAALRRALDRDELVVHLQPVVRLDGTMVGAESLVRWQHPERGLLLPGEFVPLAEASGVVEELGALVLRRACAQAAAWEQRGLPWTVGVNLSAHQIEPPLVELVREVLADSGVTPVRLVLEVTESALIDSPGAEQVLHALRALGVRLALDDFGTGYSSLTYLKRFPVDAIKIDRSFVAGLGRDADDEAIVASVVSLARSVGKTVVAEGVETVVQRDALRALGVEEAQGFLWAPPLAPEDLERWLAVRPVPAEQEGPALPPARPQRRAQPVGDDDARRILELHGRGASLHTIAAALNAEGRRTPDQRRWTTTTVARVVAGLVRP